MALAQRKSWSRAFTTKGGDRVTITTKRTRCVKNKKSAPCFETQAVDAQKRDFGFGRCVVRDVPAAGGEVCAVEWIRTHPTERAGGLGTAIYESLASVACGEGVALASDVWRSKYSDAFWKKQYRKGRAFAVTSGFDQRLSARERKRTPDAAEPISRSRRFVLHCPIDPSKVDLRRVRSRRR